MSAETSRDVSLIQDEDVLRKMWQDTEDFGQKKEIRAHMYKLREARLRDFYNTGETTTQTKQTTTTIKESTSKGGDLPTHADSLADHSFLSLKSKEIRDSESPTRDVSYKISGTPRLNDQGWNVVSSNESSADGKTHSTTRIATTSGSQPIDGGLSNYAAKSEQKATVFRDGDDKNYTKSVGASSQNVIKQEASGGDENSKFYSTSTSTSASSKFTSEQKSTTGGIHLQPVARNSDDASSKYVTEHTATVGDASVSSNTQKSSSKQVTQHHSTSQEVDFESAPRNTQASATVVRKTYTTDAPNELKKHPSYVDGSTKIITETKTLPDGSTMTTTRYETRGGKTTASHSSSSSSKHVASEQKSSSTSSKVGTHRIVTDSTSNVGDNDNITVVKYAVPDVETKVVTSRKEEAFNNVDGNFTSTKSTSSSVKVMKNQEVVNDTKEVNVDVQQGSLVDNKEIRRLEDIKLIGRDVDTRKTVQDTTRSFTHEDVINKNLINRRHDDVQRIVNREEVVTIPFGKPVGLDAQTTTKTTVVKTIGTKYGDQQVVSDDFINVERQHVIDTKVSPPRHKESIQPKAIEPAHTPTEYYVKPSEPSTPASDFLPKTVPLETQAKPNPLKEKVPEKYEMPERRQLIRPDKSEWDEKSVPTEGQYDTTYRTDYVNRRISVEVSPTHDAFARSLRAVTPDRDSRTGSTRNLRTTSSTSLRNSTSPEKITDRRQPSRSPDAFRPTSPSKKSPSGKSSPDKPANVTTVIKTSRVDTNVTANATRRKKDDTVVRDVVDRRTPDRKPSTTEQINTDTITRRKKLTDATTVKTDTESVDSSTLTRRSKKPAQTGAPRSRSVSPTSTASEIEYFRNTEVVTDLDAEDTTVTSTSTRNAKTTIRRDTYDSLVTDKRPSSLDVTKVTRKVTERSSTSPITSPRKQTPSPVKDGLPKFKEVPRQVGRKSPVKEAESPPKYFAVSPRDETTPKEKPKDKVFKRTDTYEERCRQILGIPDKKNVDRNMTDIVTTGRKPDRPKSPEKKLSSPASSPTKEAPRKPALPDAARRPSKSPDKSPFKLQEFPSQIRRSPEKQPLDKQRPEKAKPIKEPSKIQEFPSQVRRKSPEKQPSERLPEKSKPAKDAPKIREFPSQIRKSPEKESLERPEGKRMATKEAPKINEFPSQRRSPDRVSLHDMPIQPGRRDGFSSPLRSTPERETKPTTVSEFPAQVRKTPEKEPAGKYPEERKPAAKSAPTVSEFPSQIRKSPEKEPLDKYPEKTKPAKVAPTVSEFPSQVRRPAVKEPLEKYSENVKVTPTVGGVKKSPEERKPTQEITHYAKTPDSLNFVLPRQQPTDVLVQIDSDSKTSKILRAGALSDRSIEKTDRKKITNVFIDSERTDTDVTINAYTTTTKVKGHKAPKGTTGVDGTDSESTSEDEAHDEEEKEDEDETEAVEKTERSKPTPDICEFPSQTTRSPPKDAVEPYPEKTAPIRSAPTVQEFPSQVRKSPQKDTSAPYPEKTNKVGKDAPSVQEFPSQARKSPQKEMLEPYPEKTKPEKKAPTVQEFPSQIRKSPQREPLEPYPERAKPSREAPKIQEFPSQMRRRPENEPLEPYPEKTKPTRDVPKIQEFPSQKRSDDVDIIEFPSRTPAPQPEDDVIKVTSISLLETRVPVEEPLLTKKFIDTLCRDEESERLIRSETVTTERTQPMRDVVPSEDVSLRPNKTVKKDSPGKYVKSPERREVTANVVKKERMESEVAVTKTKKDVVTKTTPRSVTPVKKQPADLKKTTVTKFAGETEYTDKYCRTTKDVILRQTTIDRNKDKTATTKVTTTSIRKQPLIAKDDARSDVEEENVRRTHKTQNTYTTRATKIIQNGEVPRTVVLTITQNKLRPKQQDVKKTTPSREAPKRPGSPEKKPDDARQKPRQQHRLETKTTTEVDRNAYNTQTKKTVLKVNEIKTTRPVTKTVQKTIEIQSPKRHVVSTIINIKPKTRPESTVIKKPTMTQNVTTTTTTTKTTKLSPKVTVTSTKTTKHSGAAKPVQNGHVPSEDETEESETETTERAETYATKTTKESLRKLRTDGEKITSTVSDQVIKTQRKIPAHGTSKPGLVINPDEPTDKKQKPEKNCITTKSILIENAVADEREIIVDLKRSKSSREETPDRICPFPVPAGEDSGVPRYPDHVTEPEEGGRQRPKPKRLADIPLTESEDVTEFSRITDVTQGRTQRQETDECLLSVNAKINKYLTNAELTKRPGNSLKPTARNKPDVDFEDDDEFHLSVSDKVNKFVTTADHLTQRPKSPRHHQNVDDESSLSVSEKVSHFISTAEKVQQPTRPREGVAPKVQRPDLTEVDESIRSDECLLSVSDKVTKFITTAEKLTTPEYRKPVSLSKMEPTSKVEPNHQRSPSPKKDRPDRVSTERVTVETEEAAYARRSLSPEKTAPRDSPKYQSPTRKSHEPSPARQVESPRQVTPDRRPSNLYNRKPTEESAKPTRRDSFEPDDTPRSSRRTSQDEPKTVLSPTGRLRSTETIRKAKALFENISKEQEILKQRDILSRPSVFDYKRQRKPEDSTTAKPKPKDDVNLTDIGVDAKRTDTKRREVCTRLTYDDVEEVVSTNRTATQKTKLEADHTLKSARLIMDGIRSPDAPKSKPRSRDSTPEGDVPHYMLPLDRSVRARSPHFENVRQMEESMIRSACSDQYEETDTKTTKFGVTLRRTDSGRTITTRRRSSNASVEKHAIEPDVENVYDLHVLELLLEKVVGYDIRRRIRAQIRIVKRLIEESRSESVVVKKTRTTMSPSKEAPKRSADRSPGKYTEYETSYTRKPSSDSRPVDDRSYQHTELVSQSGSVESTTEYQSSYAYNEGCTSSEMRSERRSVSPDGKIVRNASPQQYKTVRSSSPEWRHSQNPDKNKSRQSPDKTARAFVAELKKTRPVSKTVVSEKPEWVKQRTLRKVSETGPPLKKVTTTTTTTKTTRSSPSKENRHTDVITSSYGVGPTDENGSPLFGLKALRAQNKSEKTKVQGTVIRSHYFAENGQEPVGEISVTKYSTDPKDLEGASTREKEMASVTTTQKFGYKGTPSLKTIGGKKKQVTDVDDDLLVTTKTGKVTRRGSVKEISQKFIENAVETSKSERQSSYPKAGLILRTSSFRDTASSGTGSSREGSPGMQEVSETVTTVKTSKSSSSGKAETFLSNKSRVTGVQDVITRMKNEEIGETPEDAEARNLLNKFIGAQVILSGMESSHVSSPPGTDVRTTTTKVTTTLSSDGGKPKTVTRTFTHPITEELLDTVWDEQTLKLLLEQSTDYEDRRIIRARLRQVMAEQEACAELVEKASEESGKKEPGSIQENATTHKTFSEGPVTTSQVTTRVTSQQQVSKKPLSPFAKFKQLDKQNSLNSPPSTPKTPTGGGPLFKFTDPALSRSASTVKERLLQWCQMKTKEYENIQLDNFSTSWSDGLAFCALVHHFLPDAFDYHALTPKNRRQNFTLAFRVADEKADIAPLLDVDDMVATRKPDWKCVFTYVQSIYRRFKDED